MKLPIMRNPAQNPRTFRTLPRGRSAATLRLRAVMDAKQRLEVGQRIRGLREQSPHTNRSIADFVGVGERSVAGWIGGESGPTWAHAKKVADLFDVDPYWLWAGKERAETPDVLAALETTDDPELKEMLHDALSRLQRIETAIGGDVESLNSEEGDRTQERPPPLETDRK